METVRYFEAIERGDAEALRRLIDADPSLLGARTTAGDAPGGTGGCTGLHRAVHHGQPESARVLLDAGIDVEARNAAGRTALHDAIELCCGPIERLLLDRGADVDVCSAAILGRVDRLRELLDRDPGSANDRTTGLSPLGWAAFGNQVGAAALLLDRGARLDDGELSCAASVGHVEVGRLLLDRGADPDSLHGESGANALHAAAAMKYTDDSRAFVEMLLDRGADPSIPTRQGMTALEIAERGAAEQARRAGRGGPAGHPRRFEAVAALLRLASRRSGT